MALTLQDLQFRSGLVKPIFWGGMTLKTMDCDQHFLNKNGSNSKSESVIYVLLHVYFEEYVTQWSSANTFYFYGFYFCICKFNT